MSRWSIRLAVILLCLLALPHRCPAPVIYRAGEGWSYEPVGGSKWERAKAKDQMEVAQDAFNRKEYKLALKASRRVVKRWPYSEYTPRAQYLIGRSYEARKMDERAFKEYQKLIEKYPKVENYPEVMQRQFEIASRFLGGQWFKLWGYIPFFPNMEKTADMYDKIVKNGPYSDLAPQAQMNIGTAREKLKDYPKAVQAYEKASDRYFDKPKVASEAIYKSGLAYQRQAKRAEYDQSSAGKAIAAFTDFRVLYPEDPRVNEAAQNIASLKSEQARGSFEIGRFYEKRKRWDGAVIYYSDVLQKDPDSKLATEAKRRIEVLQQRKAASAK